MEPPPDPCPAAPAGESHRWKLPDQGTAGAATCKWCGAERAFSPSASTGLWDIPREAMLRGAQAGNAASRQAHQRKAAE